MLAGGKKIEGASSGGVSVPFEAGQWLAHRVKDRFYDLEAEIIATDLHPKEGKEPSVTLRHCGSGSVVTRNADELFRTLRKNIKAGMRLITGKKSGGIMPEEAGMIFDFRAGQQIAVSGSGSFQELATVIAVDENSGRPRVKIRYSGQGYGYGEPGREVWVDARELSAEILVNGREHWVLVEEGEKIEIDAVPLDSRIKILGEELKKIGLALDPQKRAKFVLSEAMRAMRETREILWKDFQSWRAVQIRENEHNYRFDRLGTSLGNYLGGGSFIDAEDDIGREENTRRLAEIKELDRKIVLYDRALKGMTDGKHIAEVIGPAELEREMPLLRLATEEKLGAVKFDDAFEIEFGHLKRTQAAFGWRETVEAYAAVQLLYLKYHPQARSTLLNRINQMIALGVIETPLRAVATSSDLLLIENDVRIYNEELAIELGMKGGPKLSAGYGRISPDDFKIEILRLSKLEKETGKAVMKKMDSAAKVAHPLVKENQGSTSREVRVAAEYVRGLESVAGGSAKVGGAVAVGAWDVLNDPSTSVMLLSGVGVAGPMWRAVTTRLIAAGVSAERAAVLATTASGLTFHAATSTINFGLDALPGVDRSNHVDYTPEGFLRSTAMMFTLGGAQSLYGNTLKPYLRFLSERPMLQAALDGVGSKTFEILGLTGFNIGVGSVRNGLNSLSPDNMYRELLGSVEFVIAYGAMHAGRHGGRKGPAQEGYEIALQRFREVKESFSSNAEIRRFERNVITAFDAAQKEALQAFKHDLSLGKKRLGEVKELIAQQRENLRTAISNASGARDEFAVNNPSIVPSYNFLIKFLNDQVEILDALEQRIDGFAKDHGIKDAAAPSVAPPDAEAAAPAERIGPPQHTPLADTRITVNIKIRGETSSVSLDGKTLAGEDVITIGRNEGDVNFNESSRADRRVVSPDHAKLHRVDDTWFVEDAGSEYGTFIQGGGRGEWTRVPEEGAEVLQGDIIRLGPDGPEISFSVEVKSLERRTGNGTPPNGSRTTPSRPGSPFNSPAGAKPDDPKNVPGGPVGGKPTSSLEDEIAATKDRIARAQAERERLEAAERAAALAHIRAAVGKKIVTSPFNYSLERVREIILQKLTSGEKPLESALTRQLDKAEIEAPADTKWGLPRERLITVLTGALGNVLPRDVDAESTKLLGELAGLVDDLESAGLWLALDPQLRRQYSLTAERLGHKRNRTALLAELHQIDAGAGIEFEKITGDGYVSEEVFVSTVQDRLAQEFMALNLRATVTVHGAAKSRDWSVLWQDGGWLRDPARLTRVRNMLRIIEEGDVLGIWGRKLKNVRYHDVLPKMVAGLIAALDADPNRSVTAPAAASAEPNAISPPSDPELKLQDIARGVIWRKIDGGRNGPLNDVLGGQLVGHERYIIASWRWELSRGRLTAVLTGALRDVLARGDGGRTVKLLGELVELADELEQAGLWLAIDKELRDEYTEAASRLHRKRNRTALLAELHQIDAGTGIEWRKIINNGYVSEKAFAHIVKDRLGQVYMALDAMATVRDETGTLVQDLSLLWKMGGLMTNSATLANLRKLLRIIEEGDVLGIRERALQDDASFDSLPQMVATLRAALDAEPRALSQDEGGAVAASLRRLEKDLDAAMLLKNYPRGFAVIKSLLGYFGRGRRVTVLENGPGKALGTMFMLRRLQADGEDIGIFWKEPGPDASGVAEHFPDGRLELDAKVEANISVWNFPMGDAQEKGIDYMGRDVAAGGLLVIQTEHDLPTYELDGWEVVMDVVKDIDNYVLPSAQISGLIGMRGMNNHFIVLRRKPDVTP